VALPFTNTAGSIYAEYIRAQLAEERARKTSLESRGTVVLTSAGTLTTFLFGLAAFSKSAGSSFQLTTHDSIALVAALGSLLAAASLGVGLRDVGDTEGALNPAR